MNDFAHVSAWKVMITTFAMTFGMASGIITAVYCMMAIEKCYKAACGYYYDVSTAIGRKWRHFKRTQENKRRCAKQEDE